MSRRWNRWRQTITSRTDVISKANPWAAVRRDSDSLPKSEAGGHGVGGLFTTHRAFPSSRSHCPLRLQWGVLPIGYSAYCQNIVMIFTQSSIDYVEKCNIINVPFTRESFALCKSFSVEFYPLEEEIYIYKEWFCIND